MENSISNSENTKFCKHCGEKIPMDAIICTKCGRQVEEIKASNNEQPIVINNNVSASSSSNATMQGRNGIPKSKGTAIILCLLGIVGIAGLHKFYERKIGMGILYLLTGGLFFVGTIIDLITLLGKPSTYYV